MKKIRNKLANKSKDQDAVNQMDLTQQTVNLLLQDNGASNHDNQSEEEKDHENLERQAEDDDQSCNEPERLKSAAEKLAMFRNRGKLKSIDSRDSHGGGKALGKLNRKQTMDVKFHGENGGYSPMNAKRVRGTDS